MSRDLLGVTSTRKSRLLLAVIAEQQASPLQQQTQFGLGMRRPHVGDDSPASLDVLRHLHRRRPRGRPDPPYPRHPPRLGHSLVPQMDPPPRHRRMSTSCDPPNRESVTELRSDSGTMALLLMGLDR